jgi:hypothetical protein
MSAFETMFSPLVPSPTSTLSYSPVPSALAGSSISHYAFQHAGASTPSNLSPLIGRHELSRSSSIGAPGPHLLPDPMEHQYATMMVHKYERENFELKMRIQALRYVITAIILCPALI